MFHTINLLFQISALALSEKMVLAWQSKEGKNQTKLQTTSVSSKLNPTNRLNKGTIALMPTLSRVLEMGFSIESVQHALNELGAEPRAERLVSWLLQHPEIQKVYNCLPKLSCEFRHCQ